MNEFGKWQYGDAGDVYPVQRGDVWAVGPHIIACADIEEGQVDVFLDGLIKKPTLMFVDPPWDAGNATAFRTKAAVKRKVNFLSFLDKFVGIAERVGRCYVEFGQRNTPTLSDMLTSRGAKVWPTWDITYYGAKPCKLIYASWDHEEAGPRVDVSGMDEPVMTWAVLEEEPQGSVIFDPCTGQGLTAVTAQRLGHVFVGTELHPRRMAVTIDNLCKKFNFNAELIGPL